MIDTLNRNPLAGLMLVVALGFVLGRLRWRGVSLGPAGGTLLVAIAFGKAGLSFEALYGSADPKLTLGAFGFALFIYSVGFEAGPRFFTSLLGGPGWRFVAVGALVNVLAVLLAVGFGRLFELGPAVTAGVLAGALTSAPTYAAAAEATSDPNLAVSFSVAYPLGLAGVVLLVQFLPRIMHEDLRADTVPEEAEPRRGRRGPELTRAFRVENGAAVGKPLRELELTRRTGVTITRILSDGEIRIPDADSVLAAGDHLMVQGRLDELNAFAREVGPEVYDDEFRSRLSPPRQVRVLESEVCGKSLEELSLISRHHCLVLGVDRGGTHVEPEADLVLHHGDLVEVTGPVAGVREVAEELGRFERGGDETNIAVYAAGICAGLLLGRLSAGVLTLGTAGGCLFAGVLLGRFRRIGPFDAHVPRPARQLARDLGILLFVAETGVKAGGSSFAEFGALVWAALAVGALVTALPLAGAVVFGRRVLGLKPADAWGSVCGGMTSSAALLTLRNATDSNEPALSYAASYAVASVLVTLAGPLVVLLSG